MEDINIIKNKYKRLGLYKEVRRRCLRTLIKDGRKYSLMRYSGLCEVFIRVITDSLSNDSLLKGHPDYDHFKDPYLKQFPEIWKRRPLSNRILNTAFWWPQYKAEPRIKILDEAIAELENNIKKYYESAK
jgi:hypothetical protein